MALEIQTFIETKIKEYDQEFDLREGTAFKDLFIKPVTLIIQPFRDELTQVEQNQSIQSVLESADPNSYPEDAVDALLSNVFVDRKQGEQVTGTVRALFIEARSLDIPENSARFYDKNGNTFVNIAQINISSRQMAIQVSGNYFYVDVPVIAEEQGAIVVNKNEIVSWENAPSGLVSVGNESSFTVGADRETNIEFINRAKNSISVRDLVANKGIYATLTENFNSIQELQVIGFGDPEMQRDIVYNVHIGGNVDIYVKTPQLIEKTFDVFAILPDLSRQKTYHSYKAMVGESELSFGIVGIDRTNYAPVVKEILADTTASFTSLVDLTSGIDLTVVYNIKLAVTTNSGVIEYQIGLQGSNPANTTAEEILAKINTTVGFNLVQLITTGGKFLKFVCPVSGPSGSIIFKAPTGADATFEILGLNEAIYPHIFSGSSATVYLENIDYVINDSEGTIRRLISGSITDGQLVDIQFEYNPLSIDIGKPYLNGKTYEVRPGRETMSITDLAFIDVLSVEKLDPVSGEPTGEVLDAVGGFGQGLFGKGVFGVGNSSDYRLVVVTPQFKYSVFEDSYIELSPSFIGMDLRVTYRCAPEIVDIQTFVDSELERIVAADLVVKHFVPALVDMSIQYDVKSSNTSIITNEEMTSLVAEAVNDFPAANLYGLQLADIVELLYKNGAINVKLPITAKMTINHVDGSTEIFQSQDALMVPNPTLDSETSKPTSSRITHFMPREIVLARRTV